MKFVAYDGEIEFGNGILKIKKGKKDTGRIINLSDVVSVTFIKPVLTAAGCIHIQVVGAKTYPSVANVMHYATDTNAICFRKKQYEEALKFKEELDKFLANERNPQPSSTSNYDELKQLKPLLDDGIITQEDFDKKKAQILGI